MVTVTKEMVQQVECPACGAKPLQSCGHKKDKTKSHVDRLQAAQLHFNNDDVAPDKRYTGRKVFHRSER